MTVNFRPAVRENVGLWINLIGGTGTGKTFTGMRLASGISGDKPFAVIDTENRRALHYADRFKFDHAEIREPFSPDAYAEAIQGADKAGYAVIMIDSGTHEWAGHGGILDMQEHELERMAGDNWAKREACKMSSWIKPKMAHKRLVNVMLGVRAHIIFCLRAEPKIEMVKGEKGWEVRPKQSLTGLDGWIPVCEKNLPFEATASFLLMADKPGFPHPIKLQEQVIHLFPPNQPIDEESGRRLAEWASGAKKAAPVTGDSSHSGGPSPASQSAAQSPDAALFINEKQAADINTLRRDAQIPPEVFLLHFNIERLRDLPVAQLERAVLWLKNEESKRPH